MADRASGAEVVAGQNGLGHSPSTAWWLTGTVTRREFGIMRQVAGAPQ